MKIHTLGDTMVDTRRIKRLLGHYLRGYRNGKLPLKNWRGKRTPSKHWRKAISMMGRQRNHQHRVNQTRDKLATKT